MSKGATIWNNKAVALSKQGKFREAIECIDKALELEPQELQLWTNKALFLFDLGKYQEVIRCCDQILKIDPGCEGAWNEKGLAFAKLSQYEEAIACYDKYLQRNSKFAGAWINKARALEELGKYDEAVACYDNAIRLDKKNIDIDSWISQAVLLLEVGNRPKEVIKCCDEALRIDPKCAVAWHNKAIALGRLSKAEEMCKCANKAISINKEIAEEWRHLLDIPFTPVTLFCSEGEIFATRDEDSIFTRELGGSVTNRIQRLLLIFISIFILSCIVIISRPSVRAYYYHWHGNYLVQKNHDNSDQWIDDFEKATRLQPKNANYLNSYCWFGGLTGNAENVLDICEQAVLLAPDDGNIRDSRGLVRALAGDWQGAMEDFQYAIEWWKANDSYDEVRLLRQEWIIELEAGRDPFDATTLEKLLSP